MRAIIVSILSVVALTGCGAMSVNMFKRAEAHVNSQAAMSVIAAKMGSWAPPLTWHKALAEPEIDQLIALPQSRVLVGLTNIEAFEVFTWAVFSPVYGPLICIDAATGNTLWSFERNKSYAYAYNVLATSPVILVARVKQQKDVKKNASSDKNINEGDRELFALDPPTGKKLWSTTLDEKTGLVVAARSSLAVVWNAPQGQPLQAIDLNTGKQKWLRSEAPPRQVVVFGNTLYELGNGVSALDLSTGKELWRNTEAGQLFETVLPVPVENGIVVAGATTLRRLGSTGKTQWTVSGSTPPYWIGVSDSTLLVYTGSDSTSSLSAFNFKMGKHLWNRTLPSMTFSPFVMNKSRLAFTTARTLELWNMSTGATTASVGLPPTVLSDRLLDHIRFQDDAVIFVAERALGAINARDGTVRWLHSLRGTGDRTNAKLMNDVNRLTGYTPVKTSSASTAAFIDIPARMAQLNAATARQWANYVNTSGSYSIEYQIATLEQAHRAEREAANAQLQAVVTQAAAAVVVATANALNNSALHSYIERRKVALYLTRQMYDNAEQGSYIIRPVRLRLGDGILVVDSRNGSWLELASAPYEGVVNIDAFFDAQLAVIVDDKLVTKGIPLNTSVWQPYPFSIGIKTVHRALLGFDLGRMKMKPSSIYATESKGRAGADIGTCFDVVASSAKAMDCSGDKVRVKQQCVQPKAPSPSPSATVTTCAKDMDCPGDKVCVKGQCVQPAAPSPSPSANVATCAKDMDCPGDKVCEKGQCVQPAASSLSPPTSK